MNLINYLPSTADTTDTSPVFNIKIIYDNTSYSKGCQADWGFSCLINGSLLFDTGKSFDILSKNMEFLKISPALIRQIVISHNHNDHSGGIEGLLNLVAPGTKVFGTNTFINEIVNKTKKKSAEFCIINETKQLSEGIFVLKPISFKYDGSLMSETVIVLAKGNELCIITGCAHPGLESIIDNVKSEFPGKTIGLLMGGFHFFNIKESKLAEITALLKKHGISKVAPMHCTGKASIEYFRKAFGENFIEGGAGKEIRF